MLQFILFFLTNEMFLTAHTLDDNIRLFKFLSSRQRNHVSVLLPYSATVPLQDLLVLHTGTLYEEFSFFVRLSTN